MILILTSLVPAQTQRQARTIASWRRLGFSVASVNAPHEIEQFRLQGSDVPMLPAGREASAMAGKPFVYFDDIMRLASESGAELCGVVNADIELCAQDDLLPFLAEQARGGLVFGSRVDVATPDTRGGEVYGGGFDFFFFDPAIAKLFPASQFCLGLPWWDYWAPLVPLLRGVKVRQLLTPVAYHVWHPTNWHPGLFRVLGRDFLEHLREMKECVALPSELNQALDTADQRDDLAGLAYFTCAFIKEHAEPVFYPNPPDLADMAIISRNEYLRLSHAVSDCRRRIAESTAAARVVDERLEEAHATIAQLRSSLTWRLTAPLRRLLDGIRS